MKCPKCKGEGQIIKKEKGTIGYIARLGICDKCHGNGEVEMTNEEWLCGLDTEDKAREISDMTAQGYWEEELVYKWLKEKHE